MTNDPTPKKIETRAEMDKDMVLMLRAVQQHSGGYLGKPIELKDRYDVEVDASEVSPQKLWGVTVKFPDGATVEVSPDCLRYKKGKTSYYTEWTVS